MNITLRLTMGMILVALTRAELHGEPMAGAGSGKRTVLILCTGNSARSQMAEGLLRQLAGDRFQVHSAGTKPAERVNPFAVQAMAELGIDISRQTPKRMDAIVGKQEIDYLIAVCASADQECPAVVPGVAQRLSWPFEDPAAVEGSDEEKLAAFRRIRDQIREKLRAWLDAAP
jgi:arsenate reductase